MYLSLSKFSYYFFYQYSQEMQKKVIIKSCNRISLEEFLKAVCI